MVRFTTQSIALKAYALLVKSGTLRVPLVRKAFHTSYGFYKTMIEAGPIHLLQRYVRPGTVVIDVGANIGFFTARFAKWVGPEGHVIAIEPEDINLEALTAKIQKLGFTSRVKICQALVAEREGVLRLRRNELHPGDHRISHTDEGIEVRAVTVDALSMSIGQRPISFIKIDVQGAETRVINGALDTIRRHKPTLFVEIDESALNEFGTSSNELVSLLQAEGYTMTLLEPDGTELSLTASALATRLAEKSYIDVLFLQP